MNTPNTIALMGGNVGIGTTSPASLLTIGSGGQFQVNSTGNLTKINNVQYSWPSANGASGTLFTTDASGNLSWVATTSLGLATGNVTGSGSTGMVTFWTDTNVISGSSSFIWDNTNRSLSAGGVGSMLFVGTKNSFVFSDNSSIQINPDSFIGGGYSNVVVATSSFVGGGYYNEIRDGGNLHHLLVGA